MGRRHGTPTQPISVSVAVTVAETEKEMDDALFPDLEEEDDGTLKPLYTRLRTRNPGGQENNEMYIGPNPDGGTDEMVLFHGSRAKELLCEIFPYQDVETKQWKATAFRGATKSPGHYYIARTKLTLIPDYDTFVLFVMTHNRVMWPEDLLPVTASIDAHIN